MSVIINGQSLTIQDIINISRFKEKVSLDSFASQRIQNNRSVVEKLLQEGKKIYGINMAIGGLAGVPLKTNDLAQFQEALIKSHAVGAGKLATEETIRAMMTVRANQLATGFLGVRPIVIQTLIQMLNKGLTPKVYESGSVGASGDLAPLAHLALAMQGEGEIYYKGKLLSAKKSMKTARVKTIKFEAKEGLSVINGPGLIAAIGAITVFDTINWIKQFEIASAMCLEALAGNLIEFDKRIHKVKGLTGQMITAKNIRGLTKDSQILQNCYQAKQDAYSLRSIPQIVGSAREVLRFAKEMIIIEINSASDNPLIFGNDPKVVSCANFQGMHLAFGLELLGTAVTTLCVLSERKLNRLLDASLSNGLPNFLIKDISLNSGLMQVQSTVADLLVKNKVLATPAAIQSVPVSANQEDFNSMGLTTAVKTKEILQNASIILGIELMAATQALEFRKPNKPGIGVLQAYKTIRQSIKALKKDRVLYKDIEIITNLVKSRRILENVEKFVKLG